jgi:hypothetical protein
MVVSSKDSFNRFYSEIKANERFLLKSSFLWNAASLEGEINNIIVLSFLNSYFNS